MRQMLASFFLWPSKATPYSRDRISRWTFPDNIKSVKFAIVHSILVTFWMIRFPAVQSCLLGVQVSSERLRLPNHCEMNARIFGIPAAFQDKQSLQAQADVFAEDLERFIRVKRRVVHTR